jgi:DNA repair protein RadC
MVMASKNKRKLFTVSEIELIYKPKLKPSQRPTIKCSREAYDLMVNTWDLETIELMEQLKVIYLNKARKVLGILEVASGSPIQAAVDVRLIFGTALKANASSIILVHNHPSGNLKVSEPDLVTTATVKQVGAFHEILLIDHLIITSEGYLSLGDEGLL